MNKIQYANDPTGAYDYWKQDKGGEPLKEKSLEDMGYMVFEDGDGKQHKFYTDNLANLTNGSSMFSNCTKLTSFSGDLPSLTNGGQMFQYCSSLTSFIGALPNLTDGSFMFDSCTSLTSVTEDLPNLESGFFMFHWCGMTSFSGDLPKLEDGESMFDGCTDLTSFAGDLSNLTKGINMFCGTVLTSFSADLPKLKNGESMFDSCKLDKASVHRIAESIPSKPDDATSDYSLLLGIDSSLQDDTDVAADLETIKTTKKWTLTTQWN